MNHTMDKALKLAEEQGIQKPRHVFIFMDDCFGTLCQQPPPQRQGLRSSTRHIDTDPAKAFNDCLNAVHKRVQFTCEEETTDQNGYGSLAFLDVKLPRLPNGKISTQLYRKPTTTNVIIKPQS